MWGLPDWILVVGGVFFNIVQALAGAATVLCVLVVCPIGCTAITLVWTVRKMKRWGRGRQLRRARRRERGQRQREEEMRRSREAVPPNSNSNSDANANRAVVASGITAATGAQQTGESEPQHPCAVRSMASEEEIMVRRHGRPPSYRSQESLPPTRRDEGEESQSDPPPGDFERGDRAASGA